MKIIYPSLLLSLACNATHAAGQTINQTSYGDKSPVINAGGDVIVNYGDLKIFANDTPEIKAKKLTQAKRLIASEIIFNLSSLDDRLGFAEHALQLNNSDDFRSRLDKTRQQIAPALETTAKIGYEQLLAQQQATSLRAAFNSAELRPALDATFMQVLVEHHLNSDAINSFFKNLREVQHQSEALLETLSAPVLSDSEDKTVQDYQQRKLSFASNMLKNCSELAYLSGWRVLNGLNIPLSEFEPKITAFKHLTPNRMLTNAEIVTLTKALLTEEITLLNQRKALIAEAEQLRENVLGKYEKLNDSLKIQPTDTWGQVVGKAITLRQFGRSTEAVAVFAKYEEMFADKDPTAKQYAKTAQLFTMQLENLKVAGGVYIYQVLPDSVAEKAGIKVGDIVIDYNGKAIVNMDDFVKALKSAPQGELVKLTYFRLNADGSFGRDTKTLTAGLLGVGYMPI